MNRAVFDARVGIAIKEYREARMAKHRMKLMNSDVHILELLRSESAQRRIISDNCARLYGLG